MRVELTPTQTTKQNKKEIVMKIKLFQLYTVDPMSASWTYRYPYIKMLGLFVNSSIVIKLTYLLKGYASFSKDRGILNYRFWG